MGKRIFSSPKCPDQVQHPPRLIIQQVLGFIPGGREPGYEINHSLPSIAKVKNE
jgi:hypothetical protein